MNSQADKYTEFMKFFTETNYFCKESLKKFQDHYLLTDEEKEKYEKLNSREYKEELLRMEKDSICDENLAEKLEKIHLENEFFMSKVEQKESGVVYGDVTFLEFINFVLDLKKDDNQSFELNMVNELYYQAPLLEGLKARMIEILDIFEKSNYEFGNTGKSDINLINVIQEINSHLTSIQIKSKVVEISDDMKKPHITFEVQCPNLESFLYYILSNIYNNKSKLLRCAECGKFIFQPAPGQLRNAHANKPVTHEGICRTKYTRKRATIRKRQSREKNK